MMAGGGETQEVPGGEAIATWAAVLEADARLTEAVRAIPGDQLQETLRWALGDFASRPTALRMLSSADPSLTASVLPALEPFLLVAHSAVLQCRALVLRLPQEVLADFLGRLTDRVVHDPSSDDEAYRRLAELLRDAGASEPLAVLLDAASTSTDPDIREVADDFA